MPSGSCAGQGAVAERHREYVAGWGAAEQDAAGREAARLHREDVAGREAARLHREDVAGSEGAKQHREALA